jgi:hypothetical protein
VAAPTIVDVAASEVPAKSIAVAAERSKVAIVRRPSRVTTYGKSATIALETSNRPMGAIA